jgi:hypothetical protein
VTIACVSPRVKRALPWTRGNTPVRMLIGRTVRVSRPSMRGSPSRIWLRTIFASMLLNWTQARSAVRGGSRRPELHRDAVAKVVDLA